jgi:hypothetical protein
VRFKEREGQEVVELGCYQVGEETEAADCDSLEVRVQDLRDGSTLWHGAYGSQGENPEGTRPLRPGTR